jgi:hypothetical protein
MQDKFTSSVLMVWSRLPLTEFIMDTDQISAFAGFLEWGAIGLAGLMLLLVIFAILLKELTPDLKKLLQSFMIIGALCFFAALGGELYLKSISNTGKHKLVLSVLPNDLSGSGFPPPAVKLDGTVIDRSEELFIESAAALSIDVSAALGLFRNVEADASAAQAEVEQTRAALSATQAELTVANQELLEVNSLNDEIFQKFQALTMDPSLSIDPQVERQIQELNREFQMISP